MKNSTSSLVALALFAIGGLASTAHADDNDIRITEWMYKSVADKGEFVEITNTGTQSVDLTGWSQDDSTGQPGVHSMSAFGVIAAGQSVILTEIDTTQFRTQWNLASSVEVIGYGSKDNLGSGDEINIYNSANTLIDRLTYGGSGPTTSGVSGRPGSFSALGANNASLWVRSAVGDVEGSWTSTVGDVGSPGHTSFVAAAVPEPETYALMLAGLGIVGMVLRRKQSV